ncbi:unnamed protein product [marine sediment metagenome]|uniref:Uncharacterized protein n=1 Tax=marine sediment metagenome TaxID=412755 RepID=X0X907_9ZZZZ
MKIGKEEFIKKAKAVHGDKYDYSLVPDEVELSDGCYDHQMLSKSEAKT